MDMKKIMVLVALVLFTMVSTPAVASSNLVKGQKLFKKKFRKSCRFSGVRFARYHTQDEWEEIYDEGKFRNEAKRICPRLKLNKIKKSWWKYVYEFSYEYAKDGSKVPHC
jgi:hypothetical protein